VLKRNNYNHQPFSQQVKKALEDEAQHLPERVFIPGGSTNRIGWEKIRQTMYVFRQYGNYIDQPHMHLHEGIFLVYLDQSGNSRQLVLHRFDLWADNEEERSKAQQGRIKGGRVPAHEYVEEFYYRYNLFCHMLRNLSRKSRSYTGWGCIYTTKDGIDSE
jgi:hypothetical protein